MAKRSKSAAGQNPFSFAALMLGHGAQGLAFTAFTPALAAIAHEYGAHGDGALIAQLCVTIASAGVIAGALASSWIISRAGARATVLVCLVIYGLAGSGGLFLTNAVALLASRTLLGFATACLVTACISTIAAQYDDRARAKALGASSGVGSAVALAGVVLGGALAQSFGWRSAFTLYPAFAVAGLLLALAAFPSVSSAPGAAETRFDAGESSAWKLWPLYLLAALIAAVMFIGSTQFPFLIAADGIKNAGSIGLVMGAITVVGVIVSFLYGAIEHRLRPNGVLALGLASVASGMLVIGLVHSPAAAVVGAALQGVYVGLTMPYIHHMATLRAAPAVRPRAIGLLNAFNFFGALINPLVFAPVSAAFGIQGMFVLVGAAMAVVTIIALLVGVRGARMQPAG